MLSITQNSSMQKYEYIVLQNARMEPNNIKIEPGSVFSC